MRNCVAQCATDVNISVSFRQLGFFKRSRPEKDEMEQEPLKSENGHLQRDEAL